MNDGRHSLVTPIDWKPEGEKAADAAAKLCRHSLVTPIDWKLYQPLDGCFQQLGGVAILW